MRFACLVLMVFATSVSSAAAAAAATANCGPGTGTGTTSFKIAGSKALESVVHSWATGFHKVCPGYNISVDTADNSGAVGVCGTSDTIVPPDIATASIEFRTDEATTSNGWLYQCVNASTSGDVRSAIQVSAAIGGVVVASSKQSVGQICIQAIGEGGLSIDQLRWIFSNHTYEQLVNTGWNSSVLQHSDNNDTTHLWSELSSHPACQPVEIDIAGANAGSGTYRYFNDIVFADNYQNGETFDLTRYKGEATTGDLADYLNKDVNSIAFFTYSYYQNNKDRLGAYAIKNRNTPSAFVLPEEESLEDGSYNPLSRRLYMNLYDTNYSLSITVPFVEYALSQAGLDTVAENGDVPLPPWEAQVMHARLNAPGSPDLATIQCGNNTSFLYVGAGTTSYPVAAYFTGIFSDACTADIFAVTADAAYNVSQRVCGNTDYGIPLDIGAMSISLTPDVATPQGDSGFFQCIQPIPGDVRRSLLQVTVGYEALAVIVSKFGDAATCISTLGGLSADHLRWIFSSYTSDQLIAAGWNKTSVPHSDGLENTHLWSELNSACAATEIQIAGYDPTSYNGDFFTRAVLKDYSHGEKLASTRLNGFSYGALTSYPLTFVQNNSDAIAFVSLSLYNESSTKIKPVPIRNKMGTALLPLDLTIESGEYIPLSRTLYWNIHSDRIVDAMPVVEMVFQISDTIANFGYIPIGDVTKATMITRLHSGVPAPTAPTPTAQGGSAAASSSKNVNAIVGGTIGGLACLILSVAVLRMVTRRRAGKDDTFVCGTEDSADPVTPPADLT